MNIILKKISFHKSGKPRRWLLRLIFKKNMSVRPFFRKLAYKKNGLLRPRFRAFTREVAATSPEVIAANAFIREEEAILKALLPLESIVHTWRSKSDPSKLLTQSELKEEIKNALEGTKQRILVSVSNDHYRQVTGGVQLCIEHEEVQAKENGFTYLQIHPWHALPRLSHICEEPDTIISLVINGNNLGCSRMSTLTSVVYGFDEVRTEIVIHHMLGHLPEQITELIQASRSESCIFWLHDFFSICPSYTLQRNKLSYCGAPAVDSNSCELCVFGRERLSHILRMESFFRSTHVKVISPSDVTAKLWASKTNLIFESLVVIPHISLKFSHRASIPTLVNPNPIRIAYLGAPVRHKGWSVFADLVSEFAGTDYQFIVMSQQSPDIDLVNWIKVGVTANEPNAMSESVSDNQVDLVLHWPAWPETFSFTTFEALAGAAYVITNPDSGNVAAAVKETGRGIILHDEEALFKFFRSHAARKLAESRREKNLTTEVIQNRSRMSFDALI
jgi:hypothetical protein